MVDITSSNFFVPVATTIRFHLDKTEHIVNADDVSPSTTLNTYLRNVLHLTATKKMCLEGGCGVCVVAVEETINGKQNVFAVNSCLVSILSCHGWKIHTNEGIGNPLIGFHNIQKLLAANNGSQCGFCSGGMVMNMYALQEAGPITKEKIEDSFGGNLCRCTGYRAILEGFKKLASQADRIPDIEELKVCNQEQCKKHCAKSSMQRGNFCLNFTDSKWLKVYNLSDLLSVLRSNNTTNYMLVGGNTSKGVYRETTTPDVYVDITQVFELTTIMVKTDSLILGANISLTQVMDIFDHVSSKNPGFKYLKQMREHINLIANVPIGTLAGNLMIKHNHKEFPSDVFLLLETFQATIVLVNLYGTEIKVSPNDFLGYDMKKHVMKSIILNTVSDSYKYATYKIMPRAQNAHAMVNAGFLIKLHNDLVYECNIIYGGINPNFVHALKTEFSLKGQKLYDNSTLMKVYKSLDKELVCDYVLPDPTPAYRKNLAIALFYKFVLKTAPVSLVTKTHLSGGTIMDRPVSTGSQEFGTQKKNWPVSEPVIKLEALAQTSGQAEYITDLPDQPNQLFAAFVTAKAPAGSNIQSTDPSAALQMPGVVAYYDYKSLPGENNILPSVANFAVVEELFCSSQVKYYHQPIGIVVANDEVLAVEAADKVKVFYSSIDVKPLLNIQEVLQANAADRVKTESTIVSSRTGKDVKHVIKGTWSVKSQYHFHMEVQCCQVIPTEDGLNIFPSSQWMDTTQISASCILNMPMNKINTFVRRLGGGFGGKVTRNCFLTSAAAVAASKLNKPVKIWLPFETNMEMIGKRIPCYIKYEVGVNDSGVLQYMKSDLYSDYGVGGNENLDLFLSSIFKNCYDYSTWNYATHMVKTDTPGNIYARAPGTLEGIGAIESIMEHIAYTLNMDTFDVKLNNMDTKNNQKLLEFWETMKNWGEIAKRKAECKTFNAENRWKKKGISIVPMNWLLEVTGTFVALVSIFHLDGTVAVTHGGIEIGQGINTKKYPYSSQTSGEWFYEEPQRNNIQYDKVLDCGRLRIKRRGVLKRMVEATSLGKLLIAQVTAYKFGIELSKVTVKPCYNVITPNNFPTGASLTTEAIACATIEACDQLIERMKPVKEKLGNPSWEKLINECYSQKILLSANGNCSESTLRQYRIFGLCATEVQVDILTGEKQITRVDIIEDVGNSLNPLLDVGQVEGAFMMGVGHYTLEDIIFNEEGKLMTNRTWNYNTPGAKDIPVNFRIMFPKNNPNPVGILQSKAVGEPPICLSISVPLAIRNAVASARAASPNADKWFPFDGPTTVENTFLNCMNSYDQYIL